MSQTDIQADESELFEPDCVFDISITYLSRDPSQHTIHHTSTLSRAMTDATNKRLADKKLPPLYVRDSDPVAVRAEAPAVSQHRNRGRVRYRILRFLPWGSM